ncbi:MAG: PPOX class F420-dependent oxidoreductase [Chloroflexi bacterium]|nr:PPOX class F420-dependent oxidoreductase [Chloroflexota bacterium]
MNERQARDFVARSHRGVLATLKRDGRPQLSNIVYALDRDGIIKISATRTRAKTLNLRRDPRASLAVQGEHWGEYVVVEGTAAIQEGKGVLTDLRRVYEMIAGTPHPNWQEFNEAMVRDQRLLLALTIDRLYPVDR